MNSIRIITRADDLGSSHSANRAIERVVNAGFIRNVSVMACGPAVEDAAARLAHRKDICLGMHTTLNAEWDRVKWGPVLPAEMCSGLVDENGAFLPHPSLFRQTKPSVELIMREVTAQLERLRTLGFAIRYIDSHMFSELYVDGLDEAMEDFAKRNGLLDHMYYYHFLPYGRDLSQFGHQAEFPDGQYFMLIHPAEDSEEMRLTGNASVSGEAVAATRAREAELFSDPEKIRLFRDNGFTGIRYDEAERKQRLTVADLERMLSGR